MGGSIQTNKEFENNLLVGATDNVLVSDVLDPVSEDVLIDKILTFLDYKDLILLCSVCKYFNDVFHNVTEEVMLSANARKKSVVTEYIYTDTKREYKKYLSGASKKFKRFRNIKSVKLQNIGSLYCVHHHIKLFEKLPIKKLDLEKANIHYSVGRWLKRSEDPARFKHQKLLKVILFSLSPTLEYLNLTNYQGEGGNIFLYECFEKCKRLNHLIVGSRERIAKSRRIPPVFETNEKEIEERNRTLDTWFLTVAFSFAKHTKYRPTFQISIFDPLLSHSRIGKLKGLVLFDCTIYDPNTSSNHSNFSSKLSILQKIILGKRKCENTSPLIDIGFTDRYLAQIVTKNGMNHCGSSSPITIIDKPILEKLERVIVWDINNFYKFDEYCTHLKVFEGMLKDHQIERLANQNHSTLQSFSLLEKISISSDDENKESEVDLISDWFNTQEKGLIHLQKCTKLKKMEFFMPQGGDGKLYYSGFDENFMVKKKMIIPKRFQNFYIQTQDVFGGGMYPSKVGKVWVTDLRRKDEFYFFWHCEKERYTHSNGKNDEL